MVSVTPQLSRELSPKGKSTYRCGPLPDAGAGPAYSVTAVPLSMLTFSGGLGPVQRGSCYYSASGWWGGRTGQNDAVNEPVARLSVRLIRAGNISINHDEGEVTLKIHGAVHSRNGNVWG